MVLSEYCPVLVHSFRPLASPVVYEPGAPLMVLAAGWAAGVGCVAGGAGIVLFTVTFGAGGGLDDSYTWFTNCGTREASTPPGLFTDVPPELVPAPVVVAAVFDFL